MIGLRHVLAPPPRWLGPRRVALAGVAAVAAAATPPIALGVPDSARAIDGSAPALLFVVVVTILLSLALAWFALRARSTRSARLRLVLGGAAAGALAVMIAYAGVMLLHRQSPIAPPSTSEVVFTGLYAGTPLGFLFGTAYALVVLAAVRAEAEPSHDGLDRIVFAAGAVLLGASATGTKLAPLLWEYTAPPPWPALTAAGALGALLALGAAVRMIVRLRLLARAQEGEIQGFHVVPRAGREDEVPLLPLVRGAAPPSGVLAATGASAPYRGARGVLKLALAPLPEDGPRRPLASLVWAAFTQLADAAFTLAVGAGTALIFLPILVILSLSGGWG